jgi:CDP-6-deoxy-D-xylo-4-hexulose-3-dehydrase
MGENVKKFEEHFANFTGSKYCVMVNSGSSANLLAVASLFYRRAGNLKRGDEVIVPAVSWATTYYPLYQYGLKLKFIDVDINTLNYDICELAAAVTEKTKMILAVNLLGNPNDFEAINSIIGSKDIILMEDNCESMGGEFKNKQAGTFGLLGTYSTFFSHHISTIEGGLVVTNDEELYHILLSLRAHGWTRDLPKENKVSGIKSERYFDESFKFVLPGYNVRPTEIAGALGVEQLKKLPDFIRIRRQNACVFKELFGDNPYFAIQQEVGKSSWFGFSFIISDKTALNRDDVIDRLTSAGIECRPIVSGNFTKNKVIKWFDYEICGSLKNAESVDKNGFLVGNHHFDIKQQLIFLKEILEESVKGVFVSLG